MADKKKPFEGRPHPSQVEIVHKSVTKNPGGRPTIYTKELGERFCQAIENSPRGIRYICDNNEEFPTSQTVREWLNTDRDPEFTSRYARARRNQAHFISDEIIDVTYDCVPDKFGRIEKEKLMLDALKWKAKVLQPKVYGDRIEVGEVEKDTTSVVEIPSNGREVKERKK